MFGILKLILQKKQIIVCCWWIRFTRSGSEDGSQEEMASTRLGAQLSRGPTSLELSSGSQHASAHLSQCSVGDWGDLRKHGNSGLDASRIKDFDDRLFDLEAWYNAECESGNTPSSSACFHHFFRCMTYGCDLSDPQEYQQYLRNFVCSNNLFWVGVSSLEQWE